MPSQKEPSFWVIERFENGKSAGYWDGANSRSFQFNIDKAIQFRRKEDAFWAARGWHWGDTQITEHLYMAEAGYDSAKESASKEWSPEVERIRKAMMERFSDKLSMEEIAEFAYSIASPPEHAQKGK